MKQTPQKNETLIFFIFFILVLPPLNIVFKRIMYPKNHYGFIIKNVSLNFQPNGIMANSVFNAAC